MHRYADTSLSPAEKDDRQIERLTDKDTPHSRKYKDKRAPRHDLRRRRMKDHSEKREDDKDLSRQTQSSLLLAIAARVAAEPRGDIFDAMGDTLRSAKPPEPEKKVLETEKKAPSEEGKVHEPKGDPALEAKSLVTKLYSEIGKHSRELATQFRKHILDVYGPVLHAKPGEPGKSKLDPNKVMLKSQQEIVDRMNKLFGIFEKTSKIPFGGSPADIAAKISSIWPNGKPDDVVTRAGVIAAVQNAIDKTKVPASLKAVMGKEPGNVRNNAKLVEEALKDAVKDNSKVGEEDVTALAVLTSAYRALLKNPVTIEADSFMKDVDELTEQIHGEINKLLVLPKFMRSWEKAIREFAKDGEKEEKISAYNWDKEVGESLKTFFHEGDGEEPPFDSDTFVDGLESVLGKKYTEAPEELKKMVEGYRSKAASYNAPNIKAMRQRNATYHGVVQQGDPTNGPYTGYRSLDRRYFGKEHYDSIIKTAKEILKEDWAKYDWEGGAKDANFRAALDLSIWTADSNLYQAKIDVETYNMLLARLMNLKDDVFSDTLITTDDSVKPRRASSMSNQSYQNMLRIASGLRKTNPRAAFELVKNLRSFRAQEEQENEGSSEGHQSQMEHNGQEQQQDQGGAPPAPPPPPAPPAAQGQQQQQQGQQEQQGQVTDKEMDNFVEGKVDIKDLKGRLQKVVDAKDMDAFVEGLSDMDEALKKTASRTAALHDLEPLEDMDEAQTKAFLDKMKAEAHKLLATNDIEQFMEGLDSIFSQSEEAAKTVHTSSVMIPMTTLVRLAHSNPEARPVLLGMIREAAKKAKKKKDKKDKKKGKKTPPKKEEKGKKPNPFADKGKGKKPPFGGKKAPPFGGKKAPPFGKKKSSVSFDQKDADW
jgi:hypothetical protein